MTIAALQPLCKIPISYTPFLQNHHKHSIFKLGNDFKLLKDSTLNKREGFICSVSLLPVDPWAPSIDSQSIAPQLFAFSLFPYIGFLYFITKSNTAPKLTLFGFYFLLAFVGATIPAGIYAKVHYGTSLSNVDWLHGGAESLLTLTNLFIVMGLMQALRTNAQETQSTTSDLLPDIKDENKTSV
ncbi:uncharacterized protein LOC126678093 [Mercurialis annua]|uniref:uncharacterized protein LOC126678093 n=1 Tax=Mercurialis annua TaxID=3986 RepID=UPI00215F7169|nr:uncharacterized protein LOC126678093 [Mercurialis annua]